MDAARAEAGFFAVAFFRVALCGVVLVVVFLEVLAVDDLLVLDRVFFGAAFFEAVFLPVALEVEVFLAGLMGRGRYQTRSACPRRIAAPGSAHRPPSRAPYRRGAR